MLQLAIPIVIGGGAIIVGAIISQSSQNSGTNQPQLPTWAQSDSSDSTNIYDKAGQRVSPKAQCMSAPGNCSPDEQRRLQDEVNRACKQPRSCRGYVDPIQAIIRRDANRECAVARDKINKKCFAGGDVGHRNAAIDAYNSLAECEKVIR